MMIVVTFAFFGGKENGLAGKIDIVCAMGFSPRDFRAKFLREVRLSAGPPKNAVEKHQRGVAVGTKSASQHVCFRPREIAQLNRMSDIKWGDAFITNEVARCSDAEQTKGQALELGIFWTAVITFADAGEKFVGAKLTQTADSIDFIHKNNERFAFVFEIYFPERTHKPVQGRASHVCVPITFHFRFNPQFLSNVAKHAEVPLLHIEVLTDGGKVENDNRAALIAQRNRGADHKR